MRTRFGAPAQGLAQHVVEIDHAHLGPGMPGMSNIGIGPPVPAPVDVDFLVVELPSRSFLRKTSRVEDWASWPTSASSTRSSAASVGLCRLLALLLADHADRGLDEVADDLFHVAADIADFCELGGFDLEERRLGEAGEAPGDLPSCRRRSGRSSGCSSAVISLRRFSGAAAAPAVAQGNGDGALGTVLADNVAIEFRDDFAGGEFCHVIWVSGQTSRVSTVKLALV
jgi:hypothetical protein